MNRVLLVHGSPRGGRSHSRRLAEAFVQRYLDTHAGATVCRREVGRATVPALTEAWVAAAFHPTPVARPLHMQADLAVSDELVDELLGHDRLVISTPMYNFGVPSGLKAWVDQVVRPHRTVNAVRQNDAVTYHPLVHGMRALIVTTRGGHGFGPGGDYESANHADRWLRTALGFIGIDDVQVIAAERDEDSPEVFAVEYRMAEAELQALAGTW
ncbi:FMN-dependent NADH-azoreductase [Caldimonas brevitalea]|uniref:FMN dependent NADH:quinone oxidoreductase n=1 Tax=Caldimonas brevitalea TaxID=413882 RepID=A0A0G3BRE1_9BURK|nr:NAD(P)H-dependent oxidoreductase [Caldimonas brevitalea]AKJ31994.1 FMN-dependent NADH-azoreductase [Caldimonas brevitalea]